MKARKQAGSWRWIAPAGLMMIGLGFSLAGEATLWKGEGADTWQWVALGTAGLVVMNAGISVFGEAVVRRVREEQARSETKTNP